MSSDFLSDKLRQPCVEQLKAIHQRLNSLESVENCRVPNVAFDLNFFIYSSPILQLAHSLLQDLSLYFWCTLQEIVF